MNIIMSTTTNILMSIMSIITNIIITMIPPKTVRIIIKTANAVPAACAR